MGWVTEVLQECLAVWAIPCIPATLFWSVDTALPSSGGSIFHRAHGYSICCLGSHIHQWLRFTVSYDTLADQYLILYGNSTKRSQVWRLHSGPCRQHLCRRRGATKEGIKSRIVRMYNGSHTAFKWYPLQTSCTIAAKMPALTIACFHPALLRPQMQRLKLPTQSPSIIQLLSNGLGWKKPHTDRNR